jgi:hypothetical protein
MQTIKELLGFGAREYLLTAPLAEEGEGLLILGDTGTGKSQMLHQLIRQITEREPREAIICFDPVGEFVEKHYNPKTDRIWNPLDARSRYWQPSLELSTNDQRANAPERLLIAESFFPIPEHLPASSQFFARAACAAFAQILMQELTPSQIVEILSNEELFDRCLANSEHAHLIDKGAKAQRGGVLASISEAGETFKLLPSARECDQLGLTLRGCAMRRQGTLFITSTHTTRSALRRLNAACLNILITHLLSDTYRLTKRPCWVIIDEVHTLKYLPILKSVLVEGRKAGIKLVMATHNKSQFEEHYGPAAATMLAAPHSKSFFRTNEAESARWVSDMIGDEEKEERRLSTTASVQKHGRDSIGYSSGIERRPVISKEQIMSLPNLHGYWKYNDTVVPFRIEPQNYPQVARGFIPRQRKPITTAQPIQPEVNTAIPPMSLSNRELKQPEEEFDLTPDYLDCNF